MLTLTPIPTQTNPAQTTDTVALNVHIFFVSTGRSQDARTDPAV